MEYSQLLNDAENFVRVTQYEIHREEGRIIVDCLEILAGKADAKFVVIPYLVSRRDAKREFFGFGETEDEALCDCLKKIKDQPYDVVCG